MSLIANTPLSPGSTTNQDGVQAFTLNGGSATGTTNSLPGGTYTVQGQYPGDGTFGSSTSSGTSVTVNPEPSKVALAYELIDPNTGATTNATTAVFGTPSLLRINVTSAAGDACADNKPGDSGCPTGTINLTDSYNGGAAAALNGGAFALNPQGYAEDQLIDLAGGTHVLAATYGGDSSYSAPTPNPTTQTLTISSAPTQLSITTNPTSSIVGNSVALFASFTANNIYSARLPTGTVTFYSGTTQVGQAPLTGNAYINVHQALASTSTLTTSLPHGQDSITAQYSGDASYAPSTSAAVLVPVLYPTTTSLIASGSTIQHGSSETLTASVSTSQNGGPTITGSVQFYLDCVGNSLGAPVTLSNGQATFTTASLPGGNHTIIASYSGDNNYVTSNGSTSVSVLLISTTTGLSASTNATTQGQNVTFTGAVTPSQTGGPALTGTVQFASNGTNLGSPVSISSGQAQLTTSSLPVGSDQITATYSGDSNYAGSASAATTVTVNPAPTFTATANPGTITISAPGQSGSTTLTFTGENGFSTNGSAALTATCSGLPAYSSCGVSPSSVTMATNGTATTSLTVMTTAPSAVMPNAGDHWNIGGWSGVNRGTVLALATLLLLAFGMVLGLRGRPRRWGLVFALMAFAFVFANVGCGGGGSTGPSNPGTPVGSQSATVSVTINGVTQTAPVSVNVQ